MLYVVLEEASDKKLKFYGANLAYQKEMFDKQIKIFVDTNLLQQICRTLFQKCNSLKCRPSKEERSMEMSLM